MVDINTTLKCQIQTKFEPLSQDSWWRERWCRKMKDIPWGHKEGLIPEVRIISEEIGLDLDPTELLKLDSKLLEYVDSYELHPLSFSFPINQGLKVLLLKILKCIKNRVEATGCKFRDCASATIEYEDNKVAYYVDPDQEDSVNIFNSNKSYGITRLDLETYKDTGSGNIIKQLQGCPGIEALIMLLLNAVVCQLMDGITLPFMVVPGIVIGKNYYLKFFYNCDSKEFVAACVWGADAFLGHTLVAFEKSVE